LRGRRGDEESGKSAMPDRWDAADMPGLDAFDQEFEPHPARRGPRRKTWLRLSILIAAALVAAIIGALVLAWSTAGGRRPQAAATSPPRAGHPVSVEETDRLLAQVDALESDVRELRLALQQAAYTIAAMKAAEQEARSRSAHWYSNPVVLSYGIAFQEESVGAAPSDPPDARAPDGRDDGAPLSLQPPR
jgi:hypothetical protein